MEGVNAAHSDGRLGVNIAALTAHQQSKHLLQLKHKLDTLGVLEEGESH